MSTNSKGEEKEKNGEEEKEPEEKEKLRGEKKRSSGLVGFSQPADPSITCCSSLLISSSPLLLLPLVPAVPRLVPLFRYVSVISMLYYFSL